jgi:hypothetical protein
MDDMTKQILTTAAGSVVRHGLTTAAGALVTDGLIESGDSAGFVKIGTGIVMGVGALALSWWQKSGQAQVAAALKKLTAKNTTAAAVTTAQALPTGAALTKALALFAVLLASLIFVMPAMAANNATPLPSLKLKPLFPGAAATTAAPAPSGDVLANFMAQLEKVQAADVAGVIADIQLADNDAATIITPAIPATPAVPANPNATPPTPAVPAFPGSPATVKDPIAHACYPAAMQFLQSIPAVATPSGKFVGVQLFQAKRDFIAQLQAGLPTYLKLGCAPLLGDEINIAVQVFNMIGIKVVPAALTAIMPALAPITLPAMTLAP